MYENAKEINQTWQKSTTDGLDPIKIFSRTTWKMQAIIHFAVL